MKFSVNNTMRFYKIGQVCFIILMVSFLANFVGRKYIPDVYQMLIGFLWFAVFIFAFVHFMKMRKKYDVEYDGLYIRYQSPAGDGTIDLGRIKSVKIGYKEIRTRDYKDYIYLEFTSYDQTEKPVMICDMVPKKELQNLLGGYHAGYPLLQMYDDIVAKYPDKRSM